MLPDGSDEHAQGGGPIRGATTGAHPVYTRTGDEGQTGLRGGHRIGKDDLRVEAYGTVDELNASIGAARSLAADTAARVPQLLELCADLELVQHELFVVGSALAVPAAPGGGAASSGIGAEQAERLERQMDRASLELEPLATFVVPGGCPLNAALHVARTVCRRAERRCVALSRREPVERAILVYLNRLSDTLFVWARWASARLGVPETAWRKP